MAKKIRFYYRLVFALIKKQWQKLVLVLVLLFITANFVIFFSQPLFTTLANLTGKVIKPLYVEALVGEPQTFNPLFSKTEAEKEINSLVFRGLMKISDKGEPVPDLAEKFEIKDGTSYTFKLKKNLKWQDGVAFSADDVIYTIQIGQNSIYQSEIEETFRDVTVSKVDNQTINFKLKEPFAPFLSALTVGIVPKHIPLNSYRPIGTGSFRFVEIKKTDVVLEGQKVRVKFQFYPNTQTAITALKLGQVHGLPNYRSQDFDVNQWKNFKLKSSVLDYQQVMAFFNLKDDILKEKPVRQALAFATPKNQILINSAGKKGKAAVNSLPNLLNLQNNAAEKYPLNLEKAASLLANSGWVMKDGVRFKDNKRLSLTITTLDSPDFIDTAVKMRNSFKQIGVDAEVVIISGMELRNQVVPNRDFAILVTSQSLDPDPDQYVLWHTTQTKQANISGIATAKIDKLLEDGRKTLDPKVRAEKYQEFTRIILDESPAIFLYYPQFNWIVSKRIENINLADFHEPIDRFKSIDSWSISKPLI